MKFFPVLASVIINMAIAGCSVAHAKAVDNIDEQISHRQFSWSVVRSLAYAHDDYSGFEFDESCIKISFHRTSERIFVSAYSEPISTESAPDEIVVTSGEGNRCGPHLSYEFDDKGKFLRRVGVR